MIDVSLWYSPKNDEDEEGGLYVNCNDLFGWGCADAERITPENFPLYLDSLRACHAAGGEQAAETWGDALFACRSRKERPQSGWYPKMPKELHPLFDEAGPEKEIDFFNPMDKDGTYKYKGEEGVQGGTDPRAGGPLHEEDEGSQDNV